MVGKFWGRVMGTQRIVGVHALHVFGVASDGCARARVRFLVHSGMLSEVAILVIDTSARGSSNNIGASVV